MFSKLKNKLKSVFSNCIFRKEESDVDYVFFDAVAKVPVDDWNRIFKNSESCLCQSLAYLQCLESSITQPNLLRYLIIYNSQQPIAAFYFQLYDVNNMSVKKLLNDQYFKALLDKLKGLNDEKLFGTKDKKRFVVVNGNLFASESSGFACTADPESLNAWQWEKVLDLLMNSVNENSSLLCCVSKDFQTTDVVLAGKLQSAGFKPFQVDPEMNLNIQWKNFEEYLASLTTKYRTRIKSVFDKSNEIEVEELSAVVIKKYFGQINALLKNVFENAPVRLASIEANFFICQKEKFDDNYIFNILKLNNEIVGFYTALRNNKTLTAQFVGFDYALNKSHNLYYRMLIEYTKLAIDKKCMLLQFGRDALEIKSTLGATPSPLQLFLFVPGMFASFLVDPFLKIATSREWIQRQPFKQINQPSTLDLKHSA